MYPKKEMLDSEAKSRGYESHAQFSSVTQKLRAGTPDRITQRVLMFRAAYDVHRNLNGDVSGYEPHGSAIRDMLTNARHWAAAHGIDFNAAVEMSELHFEEEKPKS